MRQKSSFLFTNIFSLSILLFSVFAITSCGSKDLSYYEAPQKREADLERLVSLMSGSFISESGFTGNPEIMKTVRLDDFKRSLYVEVTRQGDAKPAYQGVWKFFDVDGDLEMQYWRLTDPPRFAGAIEDTELRKTIWMYHLRELDGCRMKITKVADESETEDIVEFKTALKENACVLGEPFQDTANLEFFVSSQDINIIARDSDESASAVFKRH